MALPTLYEYYTGGGITSGLSADQPYFKLNDKNITIFSGALHYFRVPQEYWRDRLKKIRAAGLNAVETYVPWNLHEPEPGVYDFGQGGTDYQELLDIEKFLKMAQEEDLLAIVRPGPYICAEWEFGGLPSWLLREKDIRVRTSDEIFMGHVRRYFSTLLSLLTMLQFTNGGPIVAFQIENEYAETIVNNEPLDMDYMLQLRDVFLENGVKELLFTADNPIHKNYSQIPGILHAGNFKDQVESNLNYLQSIQPDKPLIVMEYWSGWYDMWIGSHSTRSNETFSNNLNQILERSASVNFYMFHGGTNFGFLNGGNIDGYGTDNRWYNSVTSSYDYDAPLTEAGDYTDKYFSAKNIIAMYNKVETKIPDLPEPTERIAFESIDITGQLKIADILDVETNFHQSTTGVISMEDIGQSYGYIVYRKRFLNIPANSVFMIIGNVCDTAMLLINGELKSGSLDSRQSLFDFGFWRTPNATLELGDEEYFDATLDIIVENFGRVNYGKLAQFYQRKGLWHGNVTLNDEPILNWDIYPLEFKKSWTNSLTGWQQPTFERGPTMYKGILNVAEPKDTYVDMRNWHKGIVIVNGFVISRYLKLGPQQGAYLPAPFLKEGDNEIVIFEHFNPYDKVEFMVDQIFSN